MADVAFAIIGGGVIGRAVAYALSRTTDRDIVVIERSRHDHVENQSTRNAGVIHAGVYYKRSVRPLKARFCVEGNAMLYDFCKQQGVPHARCGKLVVATNALEEEYLDDVLETSLDNGVPGVRVISGDEARALEPNVAVSKALYVPSSGVVDPVSYIKKLQDAAGAHDLFDTKVVDIKAAPDGFEISTTSDRGSEIFVAETVINAAGLYSDDIARMINRDSPYTIFPLRGEAARFYMNRRAELRMTGMNVYPTPHGFYNDGRRARVGFDDFKALLASRAIRETVGVHLTPTLDEDGQLTNMISVSPCIATGVAKDDFSTGLHPPEHYWSAIKEFFPGVRVEDLELHQVGIQARLANQLDWIIEPDPTQRRFINLIGIDSPGLTSSLAIARYVVDELL